MKPTDTKPAAAAADLPPLSPEEEAAMQAEIELALEPYRKLRTPPKLLAEMRANLEHATRTHPDARRLLRGFATRRPVVVSGDKPIDGTPAVDEKPGGKEGA